MNAILGEAINRINSANDTETINRLILVMSVNLDSRSETKPHHLTQSATPSLHHPVSDTRKRTINISLHRPEPINIDTYSKFQVRLKEAQENTKQKFLNAELLEEQSNHSDAISINQMEIQSDARVPSINNFLQNSLKKIHLSRLSRYITELKNMNSSLMESVNQQQQQYVKQRQRWTAQIITMINKMQESQDRRQAVNRSKLMQLQSSLKTKNQQIFQLSQLVDTLQSRKTIAQEDKGLANGLQCSDCSLTKIKLNSIKEQALEMGKRQAKLMDECQKLQERVFDLEQQVVGIELQIQRRLKETLQSLPQLALYNNTNQQITDSVNRQNQLLRDKIQRYQKLFRSQQSLRLKQEQLNLVQRQYQLKSQALLDAIARNEAATQVSYQREHQILLAEQNLSKKIEELRKKEADLSQWQNTLTKNQISPKNNYHTAKIQTFGRNNYPSVHQVQPSNRSFGNQLSPDDFINYALTKQQVPERLAKYEANKEEIYIPMLPLNQPDYIQFPQNNHENYKLLKHYPAEKHNKPNQRSITESSYAYRSPYHQVLKTSSSNQHLHILPQRLNVQSIQGSRIKSIGNRSVSKQTHSLSRPTTQLRHYVPNSSNYRGLQSKLDRLRSELRKEIESIQ